MAYGHKQHHHHQAKHVHHPHKKKGGRIDMKVSGNPDVFEEAAEKHKKGGRVHHHEMHGRVHHHEMHGHHSKHRSDRPGRKKGGRVSGSNNNPFSSAHSGSYTSNPAGSPSPHDTYGGEKND